jgi:hypothetical protein
MLHVGEVTEGQCEHYYIILCFYRSRKNFTVKRINNMKFSYCYRTNFLRIDFPPLKYTGGGKYLNRHYTRCTYTADIDSPIQHYPQYLTATVE